MLGGRNHTLLPGRCAQRCHPDTTITKKPTHYTTISLLADFSGPVRRSMAYLLTRLHHGCGRKHHPWCVRSLGASLIQGRKSWTRTLRVRDGVPQNAAAARPDPSMGCGCNPMILSVKAQLRRKTNDMIYTHKCKTGAKCNP